MKYVNYNLETEIVNDLPKIVLELTYKDEFSNDHYLLRNNPDYEKGSEEITFEIIKNGEKKGEISLLKQNINEFFVSFFDVVEDLDFEQEFFKNNLSETISNEIMDFLKRYEDIVISAEITLEGEIKRMKKIAGLL